MLNPVISTAMSLIDGIKAAQAAEAKTIRNSAARCCNNERTKSSPFTPYNFSIKLGLKNAKAGKKWINASNSQQTVTNNCILLLSIHLFGHFIMNLNADI